MFFAEGLSPFQRVSKAVVSIMGQPRYTALRQVMLIGKRSTGDVKTACTNGRDEVYGNKFVESLTDAELRFLILHETRHKLYRHLHVWRHLYEEDAQTANMACDYAINLQIADENRDGYATMPMRDGKPIGLIDERFRNMDVAKIYRVLRQERQEQSGGQGGQGDNQDGGMDDHNWDEAQSLSEDEKKDLDKQIDQAIRQGALAAGHMGHAVSRDLQDLMRPQVDWREVLRNFAMETCSGNEYGTWRRPNRKYIAAGHYMPSTYSESVGELVVAVDTSGSITAEALTQVLSEIVGICHTVSPSAVRLLYWDTMVRGDERYDREDLDRIPSSTKPKGGGGTRITCVNKYMDEHNIKPQAVIVLTDGHLGGTWGEWAVPVLWGVIDNPQAVPPGQTVHINV